MRNLNKEQNEAIMKFLKGVYVPASRRGEYERLMRIVNTRDLLTLEKGDEGEELPFIHIDTKGKGARETFQGFEFGYGKVLEVHAKYAHILSGSQLFRVLLDGVRNLFVWEC